MRPFFMSLLQNEMPVECMNICNYSTWMKLIQVHGVQ
jgi:hypothetical protein